MKKKEQVERREEEFEQYFKEVGGRSKKWVEENSTNRTSLTIIGEDFGETYSTAINVCGDGMLLSHAIAKQMQEAAGFLRIICEAMSIYGKLTDRQKDSEEDEG